MPATVSVVIPCYNYGRYLQACVGSVLSQEGVDVRVLIIDDCSPDGSADVARALAVAHDRVEVHAHEANRGHIATYNEGLAWAAGEYTLLLSADDLLVPGALARSMAVFRESPDAGFVYGRAVRFSDGEAPPPPSLKTGRSVTWSGLEWAETRCRIGRAGIVTPEVVSRTTVQREAGGYRPDLPHSGDLEMWLRLALKANVAYLDADQAYYRVHAASMSRTQYNSLVLDARERLRAYDSAFEDAGDQRQHLIGLARQGLAAEVIWGVCRSYDRGDADPETVQTLLDFAAEICPEAHSLPEWKRLQLRRHLGTSRAPRLAPLWFPDLALHRIRLLRESFRENWWWHIRS
jgi:glycosyltransferase involved in cell wall biosynthesis